MPRRTKEERQAWYARMRELADKVRAMPQEERDRIAEERGTVNVEGRPLSGFNCAFLAMQAGKPLLQVGGFRQWQKAGRVGKKGEHAAGHIWVPMGHRKNGAENGNGNGSGLKFAAKGEKNGSRPRFGMVPVFDITQTEHVEESEAVSC